jgi:hypothetical protein
MRTHLTIRVIAVLLTMTLLTGCANEEAAKTSLFEHDHEVAPHWPDGLEDTAAKIRQRIEASELSPSAAKQRTDEIVDLISWVPEIAADTNLSEQDWLPLNSAAESLSANLRAANNEMTDSNRQQTAELCELIEQSITKIPSQLPQWNSPSP